MLITSALVGACVGPVGGWQEDPLSPEDPPVAPPVVDDATVEEPPETPPSLDELLGIEAQRDASETDAAAESDRKRGLDSALAEEGPSAAFKRAVLDMDETAVLLRAQQATGLGTQRLQARIVQRLQAMIDSAQKQQQQQPSPQGSNSDSGQDPGQRQDGGNSNSNSSSNSSSNNKAGNPIPPIHHHPRPVNLRNRSTKPGSSGEVFPRAFVN